MGSLGNARGACAAVGCCLIFLPSGVRWLWGNLTVYVTSYLCFRGGHSLNQISTPWILSIYSITWTAGVFISDPLNRRFGRMPSLLIGLILFNSGILLSFVSVVYNSVIGLNLSFAGVAGIGDGIVEMGVVLVVSDAIDKFQGLVIALIFSCCILGSIGTNQLATRYINAHNVKPQLQMGQRLFFTQLSVLERTPSFFLIYLVIMVSFCLLGTLLILFQRSSKTYPRINICVVAQVWRYCCYGDGRRECSNRPSELSNGTTSDPVASSTGEATLLREDIAKDVPESKSSSPAPTSGESDQSREDTAKDVKGDEEKEKANLTPRQILRNPIFHALWFGMCCEELAKIWFLNYYKIFGLPFIQDDFFLTNIGAATAIMAGLSRSLWGYLIERLGFKSTMMICTFAKTLIAAAYFFTPFIHKWVFGFSTLIFGFSISGFSMITTVMTVGVFGKTHFSVNYGLVCLPTLVTNLLAPLIFQAFLDNWGWFPLLCAISVMNAIALAVQMAFVPSYINK